MEEVTCLTLSIQLFAYGSAVCLWISWIQMEFRWIQMEFRWNSDGFRWIQMDSDGYVKNTVFLAYPSESI